MVNESSKELAVKIAYFATLAGGSILLGFNYAIGKARKTSESSEAGKLHQQGVELARKALARATLYSVGGFSFAIIIGLGLRKCWVYSRRQTTH